jgi:hypothetical protein
MLIVVAVGIAQWLLFAAMSAFSRAKYPKKGLRGSERNLIISSVVLLSAWLAAFDVMSLVKSQPKPQLAQAAAVSTSKGSCALITNDAHASEVTRLLGEPDEKRPHDETRGPGATIWVYKCSRCAVHLFDDRVEFVE